MKPRLIIPALAAAIAAGGAFYTLQAQDSEPKREQRRNNADAAKDQMRRMMERMDLSDEARRQFEKALENWGSGNDADDNSGQCRQAHRLRQHSD